MSIEHSESQNEILEKENLLHSLPSLYRDSYQLNGTGIRSNYYPKEKHSGDGSTIPEIIVETNVDSLKMSQESRYGIPDYNSYYDEAGFPQTTYDMKKGLDHYGLFMLGGKVPTYVFDNHVHALFAWQEAKDNGVFAGRDVALVRLDDHTDMEYHSGQELTTRESIREEIVKDSLDIKNFTVPALENELLSEMYFYNGIGLEAYKANDKNSTERDNINKYVNEGRLKDISRSVSRDPQELLKLCEQLQLDGKAVILDIDFDLFADQEEKAVYGLLPQLISQIDLVTCATSPGYIDQNIAIDLVKDFLKKAQALNPFPMSSS